MDGVAAQGGDMPVNQMDPTPLTQSSWARSCAEQDTAG